MDITCENCSGKFRIPDEKIPPGRVSSISCPKCETRILLDPVRNSASIAAESGTTNKADNFDYTKPFDFMEEEGQTALICEHNPAVRQIIENALRLMDYQITVADSARDALKRMRYHNYNLIVVDESFDTNNPEANGVLLYLERLGMSVRRNIFVAMISSRYRTMDNMMAFHSSVNIIINTKNIEDVGKIVSRGITDTELFFNIYKEALRETGRF